MPFVSRSGTRLYWRCDGDPALPPLVLANSLGTDHCLWDPVMPRLLDFFRVIRMDARGHGASDAPPGEYTVELLARDVLAVADAAGAARFDFVGVSLGGMIGQWLGIHAPQRLRRLVLCNTGARMDPASQVERIARVTAGGMAAVADTVIGRFFTPGFVARGNAHFHSVRQTLLALDSAGYAGACAAVRDMDLLDRLPQIAVPTTVVVGSRDVATPPAMGEAIAAAIPGARLVALDCAHLPHSEDPPAFVAMLAAALEPQRPAEAGAAAPAVAVGADATVAEQYRRGLERRRQALGASYVDARIANADAFNADFQQMITRWAWHDVWTRPVFDDRTRRLLVLAITTALGRWDEFRLHLRAGLDHELSPTEVRELLHQAAIYAGVPAANTAFHHAAELLRERARQQQEQDGGPPQEQDGGPQQP
jgi:3-oxoadipate enol-lactonase / 4-carboxymuconolactone decarboxylase